MEKISTLFFISPIYSFYECYALPRKNRSFQHPRRLITPLLKLNQPSSPLPILLGCPFLPWAVKGCMLLLRCKKRDLKESVPLVLVHSHFLLLPCTHPPPPMLIQGSGLMCPPQYVHCSTLRACMCNTIADMLERNEWQWQAFFN